MKVWKRSTLMLGLRCYLIAFKDMAQAFFITFKKCVPGCSKFFILSLAALFVFSTALPQRKDQYSKDSLKIFSCLVDTIVLNKETKPGNHSALISMPFLNFLCKDARFETRYIGVINKKRYLSTSGFHKLMFTDSVSKTLDGFLNNATTYTFRANNTHLLCFIKQLRLTQIDSTVTEKKANKLYTIARVEIEAFLESGDHYFPALKLDTEASSLSAKEKDFSILPGILNAFANKAAFLDSSIVLKRRAYSADEINNRYAHRLKSRINTDTILNKGVYKTMEEFLNDSPSVKEYEFNKQGILYTKIENGQMVPTREVFGFCDGRRVWINIYGFRPLVRQDKTFEFLGYASDMKLLNEITARKVQKIYLPRRSAGMGLGEYAVINGATVALATLLNPDNYPASFVYQMNLETGEFY